MRWSWRKVRICGREFCGRIRGWFRRRSEWSSRCFPFEIVRIVELDSNTIPVANKETRTVLMDFRVPLEAVSIKLVNISKELGINSQIFLFHQGTVNIENILAALAASDKMPLVAVLGLPRLSGFGRPSDIGGGSGDVPG